jgi:hypothetical protein
VWSGHGEGSTVQIKNAPVTPFWFPSEVPASGNYGTAKSSLPTAGNRDRFDPSLAACAGPKISIIRPG